MSGRGSSHEVVPLRRGRVEAETIGYDSDPTAPTERESYQAPTKIGRYVMLDVLGVGGMGIVCTAYDPKLDRKVALKLLRPRKRDHRSTSTGRARMVREAQALAKLSHPNIVTVHDVDSFEGGLYIALEYVEGETLERYLATKRATWRQIIEKFVHAGRGLAAAHDAGITHRDFKPENVLLGEDGRVRVVDFGLAKNNDEDMLESPSGSTEPPELPGDIMDFIGPASDAKLTQAGRIVGTPGYMAPEQHLARAVSPATDQFSFGVALYEALYNKLPFQEDGEHEAFWQALRGNIEPPPVRTEVPQWVHRVLLRSLQAKPEDRYPTMDAMLAALTADPAKRRRKILWIGGLVALGGWAGYGAFAALVSDPPMCTGGEDSMGVVWGVQRREAVNMALAQVRAPYAVDTALRATAALDDYAQVWTAQYAETCQATRVRGEQSEALLDIRMGCLQRLLNEQHALIKVLADADQRVLERSVNAVHGLEDPAACADVTDHYGALALPTDPELRDRVRAVQAQLDEVFALQKAGRYRAAATIAAGAIELARELPHAPTRARAAFRDALAQKSTGDTVRAEKELREAVLAAAETGMHYLETLAWIQLMSVLRRSHRVKEALALVLSAEAALLRAGSPAGLALSLTTQHGNILFAEGRLDEALAMQERALELSRKVPETDRLAIAKGNMAATLSRLGRHAEAETQLRDALEITRRVQGAEHPRAATYGYNLGVVLLGKSDLESAEDEFMRALAIRQRILGKSHNSVTNIYNSLAILHEKRGAIAEAEQWNGQALRVMRANGQTGVDFAVALTTAGDLALLSDRPQAAYGHLREALKIVAASYGSDHARAADIERALCDTHLAMGALTQAKSRCDHAVDVLRSAGPKYEKKLAPALVAAGEVELALGDDRRALAHARDGMQLLSNLGRPPVELVRAQLLLGSLLWKDPRTRDEARRLVDQAELAFVGTEGSRGSTLIGRWRRAHPD